MSQQTPQARPRKLLRDEVTEIDRDILRLLLRRHNLLEKMRQKGRLDPAEEKTLREAWQNEVAKISRDAELSGRFFSLMQGLTFLPKPSRTQTSENVPGALRREAFNLAPIKKPVNIIFTAPLDCESTQSWLYLAAASGQPLHIGPSLQNDPIIDCVKAFDQMGAAITREGDNLAAREFAPLGYPDKVIHVGNSKFNFYLLVAHYLGRPSRVKFMGDTGLKLADFTELRHLLPDLGARLTHVVPKSCGLPVRLEASGLLPPGIDYAADPDFAIALLLAAPFYEHPFAINLSDNPHRQLILSKALPLLDACGVTYNLNADTVNLEPCGIVIPHNIKIPAAPVITAFLMSFATVLGGETRLHGNWPMWPDTEALWLSLNEAGLNWRAENDVICVKNAQVLDKFNLCELTQTQLDTLRQFWPLLCALAACSALKSDHGVLPAIMAQDTEVIDFLRACGLDINAEGQLKTSEPLSYNAPSPEWAMALALAACARKQKGGLALGNPGIMTELWPAFWAIYNSLPNPRLRVEAEPEPVKSRRRIKTSVISVPPELKEEDY